MKTTSRSHSQSKSNLINKKTSTSTKSTKPKLTTKEKEKQQQQTISAGLAICLLGNFKNNKMFDSEYEEEVRKQAVMQVSCLLLSFCLGSPLFLFSSLILLSPLLCPSPLILSVSSTLMIPLSSLCVASRDTIHSFSLRALSVSLLCPLLGTRTDLQEVLPDAIMWKKWEATEAPLRQGRGWYPTLVSPLILFNPKL